MVAEIFEFLLRRQARDFVRRQYSTGPWIWSLQGPCAEEDTEMKHGAKKNTVDRLLDEGKRLARV